MSGPYDQPPQGAFGAPEDPRPGGYGQPPAPPSYGYPAPQPPQPAQPTQPGYGPPPAPAVGNPYAQQPGPYGAQQQYGAYPAGPQYPGPPAPGGPSGTNGKIVAIIGSAMVAALAISGVLLYLVTRDDGDDPNPVASGSSSSSATSASPEESVTTEPETPTDDPTPSSSDGLPAWLAVEGDCLYQTGGTESSPELEVVDCDDPDAEYQVLKRVSDGAGDESDCTGVTGADSWYYEEFGSTTYTLCLKDQAPASQS